MQLIILAGAAVMYGVCCKLELKVKAEDRIREIEEDKRLAA